MERSILWITPKWPLPAHDGARIATCQLIKHVTQLGVPVDLLAITNSQEEVNVSAAKEELGVRAVTTLLKGDLELGALHRLKMAIKLLHSPLSPVTVSGYSHPKIQSKFKEFWRNSEGNWDTVLFDGMHAAALTSNGKKFIHPSRTHKIIYRAHNVEADLWHQASTNSPSFLKKAVLRLQAKCVDTFETSLVEEADSIATVSKEDLIKFRSRVPHLSGASVPIGMNGPTFVPGAQKNREQMNFLFLGRLDWPPNRDGLHWFLSKVWPEVVKAKDNLFLTIAGKGNLDWLNEFRSLKNLEILGPVNSPGKLYEQCTLCIAPIFYGGGTRVKIIEASLHNRPCLSTTIGIEGTGLVPNISYFHAEEASDWVSTLTHLTPLKAEEIGAQAYSTISKAFCPISSAKKLLNLIEFNATRSPVNTEGVC